MKNQIRFGKKFIIVYFIFGSFLLAIFWFLSSSFLLRKLAEETEVRSRIYAEYMSRVTETEETSSPALDIIFEEVIKKIDFPIIITDEKGEIVGYRNLGKNLNPEKLKKIKERLRREKKPILLTFTDENGNQQVLGEIYYGVSQTARFVSVFPYLQIGFLIFFLLIGAWSILVYKKGEEEKVWAFLAKESAHQLATPISSFAGWLETLRSIQELNPPAKEKILKEMAEDVLKMEKVLERFSRIGQPPKLSPTSIKGVIESAFFFLQKRAPQNIKMTLEIKEDATLPLDEILLSWSLENILKNSIDAIGQEVGTIILTGQKADNLSYYQILVTDTGEGIPKEKIKDIFKPGVTTKRHGWGIGLALAKRIIEEYHKGKLSLIESRKGKTTFSILLPLPK
ncbi:MAG: HAMP domain-containing sensor histidine kinase [candidate division WOR-3 bacterium]